MSLIIYVSVAVVCVLAADGREDKKNNMWVVHVKGGEEIAKGVARDVGLTYKDKGIGEKEDHYVMLHEEHPEVDVDDVYRSLIDHQNVLWARQQVISEQSMYHFSERDDETFNDEKEQTDLNQFLTMFKDSSEYKDCKTGPFSCFELSSHLLAYLRHLGQTDVDKLGTISTDPASTSTLSTYQGATKHLNQDPKQLSAYAVRFSDPNWRKQWYVQDYRTINYPVMDHNVVPVYDMYPRLLSQLMGSTVTVGILGDGVKAHPDLGDNYVESISYNFCTNQIGSIPSSTFYSGYGGAYDIYDTVGTSSAGVIAMKANNGLCGVGIAPKTRIAGLKMVGCGNYVANIEASALQKNLNAIDIYCNTWKLDDEHGKILVALSSAVESALKLGTSEGRAGKGAIYVFPSGHNSKKSNCAANGYLNNPYSITIASASSDGKYAVYSERCSAVFATAYSGDKFTNTNNITTISANGGCAYYPDNRHVGATIASGIFALVLQYKPSLTYRDMMHLIAMTAEVAPLADNKYSWLRNGLGLWVSNDFGFGLLNAKNMFNLANDWKTVPDKHICVINENFKDPVYFDHQTSRTIMLNGDECRVGNKKINYLEHVELTFTFQYTFRGAVYINITSPARTNTQILEPRYKDYEAGITKDWTIMSVQNWGENPQGTWYVTVMAHKINGVTDPHGFIHTLSLKLHGTQEMPAHYKQARKYAAFRLPDGSTNMS